jgi:hypothetical protein
MDEYEYSLIKEVYGGDVHRYLENIRRKRRHSVSWWELERSATVFPEYAAHAKFLIGTCLGWIPCEENLLKFEPSIRAIVDLSRKGSLKDRDEFWKMVEDHIKPLRNQEMVPISHLTVSEKTMEYYKATERPYGQIVRDRLRFLLGYEPHLVHSLFVELNMRDHLSIDPMACIGKISDFDFKAIVSVKYREVLCSKGLEAANASPLIGVDLKAMFKDQMEQ